MTKSDLLRLVGELPDDVVTRLERGCPITFAVVHEGDRLVLRVIDPRQAWLWTPEWQAKEREVDDSLARGVPGRVFTSDDEFLAALDELAERT